MHTFFHPGWSYSFWKCHLSTWIVICSDLVFTCADTFNQNNSVWGKMMNTSSTCLLQEPFPPLMSALLAQCLSTNISFFLWTLLYYFMYCHGATNFCCGAFPRSGLASEFSCFNLFSTLLQTVLFHLSLKLFDQFFISSPPTPFVAIHYIYIHNVKIKFHLWIVTSDQLQTRSLFCVCVCMLDMLVYFTDVQTVRRLTDVCVHIYIYMSEWVSKWAHLNL